MKSIQPVEFLRASDVSTPQDVMEYASQQIGCGMPIGVKARGVAQRRIREEMEAQKWSFAHLIAAIDYMKSKAIRPRSIDFIFYHVDTAIRNGYLRRPVSTMDGLSQAVTEAVYLETDPDWTRRLLAARGAALQLVYNQWVSERGSIFHGG